MISAFDVCLQVIALCVASSLARVYSDRIYFETDFQEGVPLPDGPPPKMPPPAFAMAAPAPPPLSPPSPDLSIRQSGATPPAQPPPASTTLVPANIAKHYTPGLLDRGVNAITLNMVTLLDDGKENLVFSPVSIAGALSLVLLGANGQTRNDIAKFLGINAGIKYGPDGTDLIHEEISDYFKRFDTTAVGGTVRFASGVFVQEDFPVSVIYTNNVQRFYQSDVFNVNFRHLGMIETMNKINKWVSNRTEGHLPKLVSQPLPPDTTAVFINVLYFEGEWETPFVSSFLRTGNFFVSPSETVQVTFMPNLAQAYYHEDKSLGYKILGLPYKNTDITMFFILPGKGPKEFLAGVGVNDLTSMIEKATLQETIYVVPKMKLECTLQLDGPLRKMGLRTMFGPGADLRGIADGVWVDSVIQKVEIEVSETGTKAVAATMVSTTRGGGRPTVRLDRPFIFMIYNRELKTITFWGTVYKPTPIVHAESNARAASRKKY